MQLLYNVYPYIPMAEVKFAGTGVVDINGSIGGTTYARNLYGAYAKIRIGAPAGSAPLTAWNTIVADVSSAWSLSLSEDDRLSWFSRWIYHTDSMAIRNKITGFALFMSVNLNRALAGQLIVNNPPPDAPILQISQPKIWTLDAITFDISLTSTAFRFVLIYATNALPPGRMSNNQIYAFIDARLIHHIPVSILAAYTARFGVPVSGTKIFLKIYGLDSVSARRSVPQFVSSIVA